MSLVAILVVSFIWPTRPVTRGFKRQFFLAISAPPVLAPLAEQRLKGKAIPAPFIWLGGIVTTSASLVVLNNGHLTLQFAFLAIGLWSAVYLGAEVNGNATQPISKSPIACFTVPPASTVQIALPSGQESYACTHQLIGLNALEGKDGSLPAWLQTEWISHRINWDKFYESLVESTQPLTTRSVMIMGDERQLLGLQSWALVLAKSARKCQRLREILCGHILVQPK